MLQYRRKETLNVWGEEILKGQKNKETKEYKMA